jgi:uncharacterized membrane protein (UPF0127 family)
MKILRHQDELARGAIGLSPTDFDDGLLFVLPHSKAWPVEMGGVDIPLDVFWLSESGMVLEHAELFPGFPPYWPDCTATFVLEYPMRESPHHTVGDFVELP